MLDVRRLGRKDVVAGPEGTSNCPTRASCAACRGTLVVHQKTRGVLKSGAPEVEV